MAHLRQEQRQAMEGVLTKVSPLQKNLRSDAELILQPGTPLVFLGVSQGYGTCARIQGLNILVVGYAQATQGPLDDSNLVSTCKYVFLLRPAGKEELSAYEEQNGIAVRAVECLELVKDEDQQLVFRNTGQKATYVQRQM